MDFLTVYVTGFSLIVLILFVGCLRIRVKSERLATIYLRPAERNRYPRSNQLPYYSLYATDGYRQGNIFTISDDARLTDNRIADFFYLDPDSEEAARIRAQLEKDDKDLPSYDEVMRMANVMTPTAGVGGLSSGNDLSNMPAPPYMETDPNPIIVAALPAAASVSASTSSTNITASTTLSVPTSNSAPSTSRAAASTSSTYTATTGNTHAIAIPMPGTETSTVV